MPVDKFGRMSESKTKDTGVSLTYINNNYVRSDGSNPVTGSIDMRGNTIYNVADPVNPQDVVTKVYVDNTKGSGVIGRKIGDSVSIKENLDFLGKQKIKNLPDPVNDKDAVTKEYVDSKGNFLELDNPFKFKDNIYEAKDNINLKGFKISEVSLPSEDGDVATKEYIDTAAAAYLQEDQGKYTVKGDIDMGNTYTLFNVKPPIDKGDIVDKKYVDDNIPFKKFNNGFFATEEIIMRKKKLGGLREPTQDGEAATKKYVDDLQTQHVDAKGNIKFRRNINLDNKRIFALKEPRKDNEAANKKYVDDTVVERIEEEKANFLPKDPATKTYVDEAIRGLVGGDVAVSKEGVFIKDNGHYRATAPLDIDNQKVKNLPDPEDERDAVNKKYVDDAKKSLELEKVLIKENGGYNIENAYINMNFGNIKNLREPKDDADAATKGYVQKVADTTIWRIDNRFNELNQVVSVVGSCYEDLKLKDYQFTFGGPILNGRLNDLDRFNGFLVPANGLLLNFVTFSTGLVVNIPSMTRDELKGNLTKTLIRLYGNKDNLTKIFSLVKIENEGKEEEVVGGIYFYLTNIRNYEGVFNKDDAFYSVEPEFKFIIEEKFKSKDENFVCSVNRGDIINIRTEYRENKFELFEDPIVGFPLLFYEALEGEEKKYNRESKSLHTTTLTFLFKEMSFPNVLN